MHYYLSSQSQRELIKRFAFFALRQFKKRPLLPFWTWLICFGISFFLGTFPGDIYDGYMRAKGEIYFFSDGLRVSYFAFILLSLAIYFIGKKFPTQEPDTNPDTSNPIQSQTDETNYAWSLKQISGLKTLT